MRKPDAEKVVAYITRGSELLVFRHTEYPEAGIQVPGGTIEPGETPALAVLREAREESGLDDLTIHAFLGWRDHELALNGVDTVHRRFYFHLEFKDAAPARWLSYEMNPSDGTPGPIKLEMYWAQIPDQIPELAGEQGALLSRLTLA